jgi:hypothetical protein
MDLIRIGNWISILLFYFTRILKLNEVLNTTI